MVMVRPPSDGGRSEGVPRSNSVAIKQPTRTDVIMGTAVLRRTVLRLGLVALFVGATVWTVLARRVIPLGSEPRSTPQKPGAEAWAIRGGEGRTASIWCRNGGLITINELWETIQNAFLQHSFEFSPPLDSDDAADDHWGAIDVGYQPVHPGATEIRPGGISIWASYIDEGRDDGLAEAAVDEIARQLGQEALMARSGRITVEDHIMSSLRAYELEVVHPGDMADRISAVIERFIASRLDGLVYVGGFGIFDVNPHPIAKPH